MKDFVLQIIVTGFIFITPLKAFANNENMEVMTIIHDSRADYNIASLSTDIMHHLRQQLHLEIYELTRTQSSEMADYYLENYYIQKLAKTYSDYNG